MPSRSDFRHHLNHLLVFRLLAVAFAIALIPRADAQDNGITVGQPKVYDGQSLAIMLDQLNTRLQQIQVIDQQSLLKAFGLFQGSQQTDLSRSFDVSVSLTPKAAAATPSSKSSGSSDGTTNTNSGGSSGDSSKSDSSKSTSSSTKDSGSGTALPDLLAAPSFKPDYGENSSDLLSDQVDVTYQIFNLRMLLERSLTDRLKDGHPRRQAIISFNITLDPPANAKDAAAFVEITLSTERGPLSLVASMPQEKTYNATALSNRSTAFAGSAVAKIITVGYNQRKRSQTFFLYRDSDTLAIERPPVGNAVTFGWVFRPVLGRRSVSPGMRQMFAVVALPETDQSTDDKPSYITASAKTYWRHFDKDTATSTVTPGFWDWSAKKVPTATNAQLANIEVLPTAPVEASLRARVQSVQLLQVTNGSAILQLDGENFFPGTTVTIGEKTLQGTQDGLFIKSSQSMLVNINSDVLSKALNAVVNGRYGPSVPFYQTSVPGITILTAKLQPKGQKFSQLSLMLGKMATNGSTSPLSLAEINNLPRPILSINGTSIPLTPVVQQTLVGPSNHTQPYVFVSVTIPNSQVPTRDNRAGIIFPLLGQNWYSEAVIYDDAEVQVTKFSGGKTTTLIISRAGLEFTGNWRVILDKLYRVDEVEPSAVKPNPKDHDKKVVATPPPVQFSRMLPCKNGTQDETGCYILRLVADTKFLTDYKKFVLVSDAGYAQTLDIPSSAPQPETTSTKPPKITAVVPSTVGANEVVTLTVSGTGLEAIKQISFEGKPITFWLVSSADNAAAPEVGGQQNDSAGKPGQMRILLTRDVTGKEGTQELLLQVDTKTMLTVPVTVSPAPTSTKSPAETGGKPK